MKIENIASLEVRLPLLEKMCGAELVAVHLIERGGIEALEQLKAAGVTLANVDAMLFSLRGCLMQTHEVASARGVILPGYT